MQDPASTLATIFSETLKYNGVENKGGELRPETSKIEKYEEDQGMKEIYVNYSPSLEKIIALTNKHSINLFAEHLKLEVEKVNSKKVKTLWSKNIDTDGMYIYDGSGLSRYDGVTPNNIVEVLKYMYSSDEFDVFYNSLGKPGESGTFKTFKKGTVLVENLHAKSGTLTGVKAYSGYMYNKDGDMLAFSILVNHHGMSGTAMGKELEKIMESFYYMK
jgi:D-alanyl-D-alanine carboxypeptidase/D-alanyl-D-alanine-endopeptidase (penicillin-binding protein 4)